MEHLADMPLGRIDVGFGGKADLDQGGADVGF